MSETVPDLVKVNDAIERIKDAVDADPDMSDRTKAFLEGQLPSEPAQPRLGPHLLSTTVVLRIDPQTIERLMQVRDFLGRPRGKKSELVREVIDVGLRRVERRLARATAEAAREVAGEVK